ncbi:hypothetical protein ACFXGA_25075 [Actinosynnema sp. NPDC059335]|uniref:hypothetical protein n=1 Tax=Actinosynnema sp. NPDC059335 TaxID=3346804 RepID=UPI00366B8CFD
MGLRFLALALALLAAGCAARGESALPDLPEQRAMPGAPGRTAGPDPASFPVTASPRPIVLIGSPPALVRTAGSEQEKVAAGSGRFTFGGVEPPTPGPVSVRLPDGPATFPVIGVREALTAMSADGRDGDPLEFVAVELGTAEFPTDRGRRELPAWRFSTALGSVWAWPAITPDAFWRLGEVGFALDQGAVADGRQLEVQLPAPAPPCPGEEPTVLEPVVEEGATAVKVGVRTVSGGGGSCVRDAMYRSQTYTVTLAEPLGARLLVDDNGGVFAVATR